jgi:hypothetical protein
MFLPALARLAGMMLMLMLILIQRARPERDGDRSAGVPA